MPKVTNCRKALVRPVVLRSSGGLVDVPHGFKGRTVLVDICSGSGSVANGAYWAGFDLIITVDNDPKQGATDCISILDKGAMHALGLRVEALRRKGYRVAVHASPPCQQFSILGNVSRSQKTDLVNAANLAEAIAMVNAVMDFAKKHADVWTLENPGTGSLWTLYASMIRHDISRQVRLDICRYGSLMKKNMIIAFSSDAAKERFGEPLECLKEKCLSMHSNPKTGFVTRVHVPVNELPLAQRIAFPEQLSVNLMSAVLDTLRTFVPVVVSVSVPVIIREIIAHRDIEDGEVSVRFTGDAKQLWHRIDFVDALEHDWLCEESRKTFCHDSGLYVVEKIVDRREGHVFIKWQGYSESFNTWEPAANLE